MRTAYSLPGIAIHSDLLLAAFMSVPFYDLTTPLDDKVGQDAGYVLRFAVSQIVCSMRSLGMGEDEIRCFTGDDDDSDYLGVFKHFGPLAADYVNYTRGIQFLIVIAFGLIDRLKGVKLEPDAKRVVIDKLLEDIDQCTPGYFDRVREAVLILKTPTDLFGLLALMRHDLVERVGAATITDEIHTHQRVRDLAVKLGLGVPHDGTEAVNGGVLDDGEIEAALARQFLVEYTPAKIVQNLFLTICHEYKYLGRNPEGMKNTTYVPIFEFLKRFFEPYKAFLGVSRFEYSDFFEMAGEYGPFYDVDWCRLDTWLIRVLDSKDCFESVAGLPVEDAILLDDVLHVFRYDAGSDINNMRITYSVSGDDYITYPGICRERTTPFFERIPERVIASWVLQCQHNGLINATLGQLSQTTQSTVIKQVFDGIDLETDDGQFRAFFSAIVSNPDNDQLLRVFLKELKESSLCVRELFSQLLGSFSEECIQSLYLKHFCPLGRTAWEVKLFGRISVSGMSRQIARHAPIISDEDLAVDVLRHTGSELGQAQDVRVWVTRLG